MSAVVVVLGFLLALSELLSLLPGVRANGVFQLTLGVIAKLYDAVKPGAPPAS